jgi:hypothetical protein
MLLQARHCDSRGHAVGRMVLFVSVQAVHNVKRSGLALESSWVENRERKRGTGDRLQVNAADRRKSDKRFLIQLTRLKFWQQLLPLSPS